MFSQASVILSTGGHDWQRGVHGEGCGHVWQRGACMVEMACVACLAGSMHGGGVHGKGHAWQESCMAGGVCVEVFKVNFP